MHLVVMKIVGTVHRVEGTPWDYQNRARPSALGVGGAGCCEIILADPEGVVTETPQPAELHFSRIVQFDDGAEEIELYDGRKLVMKFRPTNLADLKCAAITD